jgi:hypothetical protein
MSNATMEAPGTGKIKFREMTPEQKKEYYAAGKAKREARKSNKWKAPAGASYVDEHGKFTFTVAPPEYDAKTFADLEESDFAREDMFVDYRAGLLEHRAAKLRSEAEAIRKGGPRLKGGAKKLLAIQQKFEALKASLIAEGIDVESVLASLKG